MIPDKETNIEKTNSQESKYGSFALFDMAHFLNRILKNWYWFIMMFIIGYTISWIYTKYYAQNIYASNLSLSVSNNAASYFTPNQSINFIWGQGGNQDGVYLKKMLLSRTHNEFLVKELGLYVNYSTKGVIKSTYLDKDDVPVLLEVDKNHLQQVEYPITLIPKGIDRFEIVLPEEGHSQTLYSYKTEGFNTIAPYDKPDNQVIRVGDWFTSHNLRFRLVKNPVTPKIKLQNIIVTFSTVNNAVNDIVSTISIDFDKEINSIMIITKKGYNLNGKIGRAHV
jgi:hypothetical protein